MNLGSIVLMLYSVAISARDSSSRSRVSENPWQSLKVQAFAAGTSSSMPVLSIELVLACINRRAASGRELLLSFVVGIGVLASQIVVGRVIATMRRPYAEWLILDIAG